VRTPSSIDSRRRPHPAPDLRQTQWRSGFYSEGILGEGGTTNEAFDSDTHRARGARPAVPSGREGGPSTPFYDYGTVPVGSTASVTITFTNQGSRPVTITGLRKANF
jgi:hypothetical protein